MLAGFLSANLLAHLRQRIDQLFDEEGEAAGSEFKQEPGCRRLARSSRPRSSEPAPSV